MLTKFHVRCQSLCKPDGTIFGAYKILLLHNRYWGLSETTPGSKGLKIKVVTLYAGYKRRLRTDDDTTLWPLRTTYKAYNLSMSLNCVVARRLYHKFEFHSQSTCIFSRERGTIQHLCAKVCTFCILED